MTLIPKFISGLSAEERAEVIHTLTRLSHNDLSPSLSLMIKDQLDQLIDLHCIQNNICLLDQMLDAMMLDEDEIAFLHSFSHNNVNIIDWY